MVKEIHMGTNLQICASSDRFRGTFFSIAL